MDHPRPAAASGDQSIDRARTRPGRDLLLAVLLGTRQSRDATESELVQIWPTRNAVPGEVWRSLLRQATKQVDILIYAGSFLFEAYDLVETIRTKSADGTDFRVLVGDGRSEAVRVRSREEGRPAIGDRCRSSLEYISVVADLPGVQVRTHQTTLYVSVFRFDDSMLINNHTYGSFASHSPVMHLRRVPGGQLFDFYAQSVERVWATGRAGNVVSMARRIDYYDDPAAPPANSVKPAAAAFVLRDGKVLLTQRTDNGNWSMPSGAHDLGESLTQTAVRETLEETGITVRPTGVAGIFTDPRHVTHYTSDDEVRQEFSVVYRAEYVSGQPTPSAEDDPRGMGARRPAGHAADGSTASASASAGR